MNADLTPVDDGDEAEENTDDEEDEERRLAPGITRQGLYGPYSPVAQRSQAAVHGTDTQRDLRVHKALDGLSPVQGARIIRERQATEVKKA